MAHRTVLTARQRAALFDLATDQASLLKHYTLSDDDIRHIRTRRRPENQIGFALQLCAFRYPGRLLKPGEVIPDEVARFLAAQLGLKPDDLLPYAAREKTRREHLGSLRKIYGYKMFNGKRVKPMRSWLDQHAEDAQSSEGMVRGFVEECRRRQIILPGLTVIERHCADALVAAERRIDTRIAARLDSAMRRCLDDLLHEEMDNRTSRFVWLRQFEVGKNSADINRQLDRLEFLQGIVLARWFWTTFQPIESRACADRGSDILRMGFGTSPVIGAWPSLLFALWNGRRLSLIPSSKPMTGLWERSGGMQRRSVTRALLKLKWR